MIDMTEGEAEYLKYRFKQYLGSVSREIQNRRLKEMSGITDVVICGEKVASWYKTDKGFEVCFMTLDKNICISVLKMILNELKLTEVLENEE